MTSGDVANLGLLHAEIGGNVDVSSAFGKLGADLLNIGFCQLGGLVALARQTSSAMTSFFAHVGNVVDLCSEKEVMRVHTGRNVASMQHENIGCHDPTVVQFIRDAMSPKALTSVFDEAVSVPVFVSSPKPAIPQIANVNVLPKTIFDRNRRSASHVGKFTDGAP